MFVYEKKLQYPVKIKNTNPKLAAVIISQYGGPDGELGASLRYLSQRFSMPYPELKGLLTDIGTEELGHLEMIGAIVHQLTRNLTDEQIDTLVSREGLIGLNLCAKFLGNDGDTGMDAVLRHISHFLSHGAENILAFGCDFDGCTVHETLNGIDRLPDLFSYLLGHGISEEQLEKIYFLNGYRFLVANL